MKQAIISSLKTENKKKKNNTSGVVFFSKIGVDIKKMCDIILYIRKGEGMIKKFVGKLKVSSDNTLFDLLVKRNGKDKYKNFNIECVLAPASWQKFDASIEKNKFGRFTKTFNKTLEREIIFEKMLKSEEFRQVDKNMFNHMFDKSLVEEDYFQKKLSKGAGVFMHGFTRINDEIFYSLGVTHSNEYNKIFLIRGSECLSLTLMGKVGENNAVLSKANVGKNYYDEYCCGFGTVKSGDILGEITYVEGAVLLSGMRIIADKQTLLNLKSVLKSNNLINESYESNEDALFYENYTHYEMAERIDPYDMLKRIEKKICDAMEEKFGIRYYSEVSYEQKVIGVNETIADYFEELREKFVKEEIKNIKVRKSKHTERLIENAFQNVLYFSFYGNNNVGMSLAKELLDNYNFQDYVCKYNSYHYYIQSLMETLERKELLVKDVLTLYKNAEKILILTPTEIYNQNASVDLDQLALLSLGVETKKVSTAFAPKEYLTKNFEKMGFNEFEIRQLMIGYDTFSELEDSFYSEICFEKNENEKEVNEDKALEKAGELVYKKLLSEFAKRITGIHRKENRLAIKKEDVNFLETAEFDKDGKIVKETHADEVKAVARENTKGFFS